MWSDSSARRKIDCLGGRPTRLKKQRASGKIKKQQASERFKKEGDLIEKGDRIGKYIILEKLGSGGEGSVYLGMHVQTQQLWALKVIPATRQSMHEVKVLRKLHHRSLPSIVDVLEWNGMVVLVMTYVRGQSLRQIMLRRGRLSEQQVIDTAMQVGEALRYLHSRTPKVLHLDIKPDNIICGVDGTLVLVDFGAAFREDGGKLPGKGTQQFAPPEQSDPQGKVDERSDLYALGATLYLLASGKTYSSVLYQGRVPGCGDALSEVIRSCLAKEPEKRVGCAEDFLHSMQQADRGAAKAKHRRRLLLAICLSLFALILASRTAFVYMERQIKKDWSYEEMVEQAALLPRAEGLRACEQAILLRQGQADAYLQYLAILLADGEIDAAEDEQIRMLLHSILPGSTLTNEEKLQEQPEEYGRVCCALGYLYRYGYAQEGRRISGGWFQRAVDAAKQCKVRPAWIEAASAYAEEETFAAVPAEEWPDDAQQTETEQESWAKLCEKLARREDVPQTVQGEFYLEISESLAAHAAFWPEAGIEASRIRSVIAQIQAEQQTWEQAVDKITVRSIAENLETASLLLTHQMTEGEMES